MSNKQEVMGKEEVQDSFSNSSCPYAKAIHAPDGASSLPGLVELRECPVFSKECPFKDASNPQDFNELLKQIPAGHMAKNGPLYQSLKFFHETQESPSGGGSGKCPVREHVSSVPEEWSELSLVSIMAEMAKQKGAKCPWPFSIMAEMAKQKNTTTQKEMKKEGAKCPWPFTIFHDQQAFMQAWQSWFLLGVLLLWLYSSVISA